MLWRRRVWGLITFALCLLSMFSVIVQLRPWTPRFDEIWIPPVRETNGYDLTDLLILDYLATVEANPKLQRALSGRRSMLTLEKPLWVDACEVSQNAFRQFLLWYARRGKHSACATLEPKGYKHYSASADHPAMGALSRPVTGISFFDAIAYCRAAGGRLPTSDEWQAIAGGREGRRYPWGDKPVQQPWEGSERLPESCRTYPSTDSPEGVYDLGTGVSEWTLGNYPDGLPAVSGGNAHAHAASLYALVFVLLESGIEERSIYVGFRCVYDESLLNPGSIRMPWGRDSQVRRIDSGDYPVGPSPDARFPKLIRAVGADGLKQASSLLMISSQHGVAFASHEVTRRDYRKFLRDPFVLAHFYANPAQPARHSYVPLDWDEQLQDLDLPVFGVDWWGADAFARWAGGRLPTADEWVNAASDGGRFLYPWGDEYHAGYAATRDARLKNPVTPEKFLRDVTPKGIFDLGGNVSEWTVSVEPSGGQDLSLRAVVKGGNFRIPGRLSSLVAFEALVPLGFKSRTVGLRVVFDREPPATTAGEEN